MPVRHLRVRRVDVLLPVYVGRRLGVLVVRRLLQSVRRRQVRLWSQRAKVLQ